MNTVYPALLLELKKRNVRKKDIAALIHVSDKGLYNKLHGVSDFTNEEIRIIHEAYFADLSEESVGSLFSTTIFPAQEEIKPTVSVGTRSVKPEIATVLPVSEEPAESGITGNAISNPIGGSGKKTGITGNAIGNPIGGSGKKTGITGKRRPKRKIKLAANRLKYSGGLFLGFYFGFATFDDTYPKKTELYLSIRFLAYDFVLGLLTKIYE